MVNNTKTYVSNSYIFRNKILSYVKNIIPKINNNYFYAPAFNAGFYIVSYHHFEETKLKIFINKLINVQQKYNCFKFGTQNILNFLTYNNCTFVDKRWNSFNSDKNEILKDFFIFHWNRQQKPWITNHPIWMEYRTIYEKFIYTFKEKETILLN